MVEKFFLIYLQLVDVVQSSLHWKKKLLSHQMQKQMWHRSNNFQNRENF